MLIDASLLRRARIENIERLAKALGVDAPRRRRDAVYANQLVSAVATKIRREAMMDELRRLTGVSNGHGTSFGIGSGGSRVRGRA